MLPSETASRSIGDGSGLEVIGRNEAPGEFLVRHPQTGNISRIMDTSVEKFLVVETSPANSTSLLFLLCENSL